MTHIFRKFQFNDSGMEDINEVMEGYLSPMFNLMEDKLIRMKTDDALIQSSLPEVLDFMMKDKVLAFPSLRPHQRHPWHAFLAQLGAMALAKSGESNIPTECESWRNLISKLTPNFQNEEPWQLVVDDFTKPAFMQPPGRSAQKISEYKGLCRTPDELDMLVTSKNHDLKSSVALDGWTDDWLFSLITLQTSEGYSGSGNFGISRMNGGYGNRPSLSLTPSERPGAHLRRDVLALLELRRKIMNRHEMDDRGLSLLWCVPWDGTKEEALTISELEPYYIEICRRARMFLCEDGRLVCAKATSKGTRINARDFNGNVGDPWTPIDGRGPKSLTLNVGGFHYRRFAQYLFSGDWVLPDLLRPTEAERKSSESMLLLARATVRGQGKTEGYYERVLPIRNRIKGALGRASRELGDIVEQHIREVATIQSILRHAISVFAAGGKREGISDEQRHRAIPWSDKLDSYVDSRFFEKFQDELEADSPEKRLQVRKRWMLEVVNEARQLLLQATDALPCPAIQRYRARASAEGLFEGRIRGPKGLPEYFMNTEIENV